MKNNFELIVLPGTCFPGGKFSNLYEQVYAAWKQTWVGVFSEVGSPEFWNADGFFRSDAIPVILHEGKVAAFYVATVYSMQRVWVQDHSYFSIFDATAIEALEQRRVRNVMSYEFLSVMPQWKKSILGYSLAAVLVELGLSLRDDLECDAAVGVARIQNKIEQIAHGVGAFTLQPEARRGNLVCEIVGFTKENDRPYPDAQVHKLAEKLWSERRIVDQYGNEIRNLKLKTAA